MRRQFPEQQAGWLNDVFGVLDAAAVEQLVSAGQALTLGEGDRFPSVKEGLVRVVSGLVRVAVTSVDRNLTVLLLGPNDTFSASMYHGWENDLYFLQAEEETEVVIIPRDAVLEVAANNAAFSQQLMQQLSQVTWSLMNTVHMLAFYNLPQRVAQVLVNLTTMFGMPDERIGMKVGLRFTQEELAEMAGARRETLSTVLQDFRDDDVLDLRYARINVRDFDGLKRIAGVEPLPFLNPGLGIRNRKR